MIQERYFSKSNDPRFKIIMVGDTNVGKTTLFWKYMEGEFLSNKNESVTIIDFKIKEVQIASQPIKLFIWDTAGQEKYRSMISAYFNGCQGVMLVFDLTSPPSYVNATTKWYDIAKSKCPDAIIMLIGNKSDLPTMVNEQQAEQWARRNRVQYMKTSVKNDINVNECYQILSEAIYNRPIVKKTQSFALNKKDISKDKKGCC